jgi:GNAT superfamily N-acetyltransferase
VTSVHLPDGFRIVPLEKKHKRSDFDCGEPMADRWLRENARQAQDKRLSVTRVLVDGPDRVVGFYTLAMGHVSFSDLPREITGRLPNTLLPIVTLAWLAVDRAHQGRGLGKRLLAQALNDCHATGQLMPFVAVILDCLHPRSKLFYQRYDFSEVPGYPMKLVLPWNLLDAMIH